MIDPIKGEYGICQFGDCLDFLSTVKDKEYAIGITDPPYNDGEETVKGQHYKAKRNIQQYSNKIPDYPNWCLKWFEELKRTCERIIFTCGRNNLEFWLSHYPKQFNIGIWKVPNAPSLGYISHNIQFDYILFYGDFHWVYPSEIFVANANLGIMIRTKEDKAIDHPHPKPLPLWEKLIIPLLPIKNMLDIFGGSCVTGELGEKYRIKWKTIEIDDFSKSSQIRITRGLNHRVTLCY